MIGPRVRRAAALAALICTLALAVPAHAAAAGWRGPALGAGWLDSALQWIARLWIGDREPARKPPAMGKNTSGSNPDGSPQAVTPPATPNGVSTSGADPKG